VLQHSETVQVDTVVLKQYRTRVLTSSLELRPTALGALNGRAVNSKIRDNPTNEAVVT
jgi:hypothetical protein